MSLHSITVLFLFSVFITTSSGHLTLELLQNRHVFVTPPQDVTVFLRAADRVILAWYPPNVYIPHDVSAQAFENLENGHKVDVMKPDFHLIPVPKNELTDNGTDTTNTTSDVAATDKTSTKVIDDDSVNLTPVVCRPVSSFANYTVGEKGPSINDSSWAVSLLDSNAPIEVTNMTVDHSDKEHHLVKFEEGCVTKITVTHSRMDSRPDESEIVLNASDHLVSIEGLRSGTTYKIVVTAHFVSGDAMSAKALYVPTLLKGQPQICKCDWHGTQNLSSDCSDPSKGPQHCECKDAYTSRFCEDCAEGFYRDKPASACKPCPCSEHSHAKSSCHFAEGFLTCDQCVEGYSGNVCHRCAFDYYRHKDKCLPCKCNNNTRPSAPMECSPVTGSCIDCQYNTSGFYCERCRSGYARKADDDSCVLLSELEGLGKKHGSHSSSPSKGVIAAVVFVIIVCVCVVVGLIVCRRIRANRQRRGLWTVEMRPDNDDLDFNSVHNEDAHMDDVDDLKFHDSSRRGKSSGKYSRLNEDC